VPGDLLPQAADLVGRYGYPAVGLYMVVEGLGVPLFSEVFLAFVGYLATLGHLDPVALVAWATAGSVLGATLSYAIGRYGGRALLIRVAGSMRVGAGGVARAEAWFGRSGALAILVGRHVSGVRLVLPYAAGAFRMAPAPFVLYTAVGAAMWALATIGAGYWLGRDWRRLMVVFHHLGVGLGALAAAAAAALAWKASGCQSRRRQEGDGD
jgi:membrane protein DedA with SNARE-associated domain